MSAPDASHKAVLNALRGLADDYSRAREAVALTDAGHRNPQRMRELYLGDGSKTGASGEDARFHRLDADALRERRLAVAFKLAAIAVVLGLIGTIAVIA